MRGDPDLKPDCLHLLLPQAIPSQRAVAEWFGSSRRGIEISAHWPDDSIVTNPAMAGMLSRMISTIPEPDNVGEIEQDHDDDLAHDAYFRVHRVEGCPPEIFIRMVLSARLIFLQEVEEAPVSVPKACLQQIDRALADLISSVCEVSQDGTPYVSEWVSRGVTVRPMSRWVRGHQVFAALAQGLIFSFQSMALAIREGRGEDVRRWAKLSVRLLEGSGAAFVLTGDFSAEEYSNLVRPSMMSPACSINLSGLMSADHRFLMQTLRDMRPALKALHEHERELHDELKQALSAVYDSHIHVCERFVGEKPSILTARHARKSGPALIEQFQALRMKAFDSSIHTPRLTVETIAVATGSTSLENTGALDQSASHEEMEHLLCQRNV